MAFMGFFNYAIYPSYQITYHVSPTQFQTSSQGYQVRRVVALSMEGAKIPQAYRASAPIPARCRATIAYKIGKHITGMRVTAI